MDVSERRACRASDQPRSTQRYAPAERDAEKALVERMRELAREHPRYGDRRITALLQSESWSVNRKWVHRLWRQEGLKAPQKRRKRGRLGWSENGCTRRRADRPDHVWSDDSILNQTADGRRLIILPVVDEDPRDPLSIAVWRGMTAEDGVSTLGFRFEVRDESGQIRSDNGPEFIAEAVKGWLARAKA